VFSELDRSHVICCADPNPARLEGVSKRFPHVQTVSDYRSCLDNPRIDAVVIATPTDTHAQIVRDALSAGKHVLVEKPVCVHADEAYELHQAAEQANRALMVGHVFLFNNAIVRLHEMIAAGELGGVHYLDAARTNLGPIRGDVNALYDLATHDISIMNYLLGQSPVEVSAVGRCITQQHIEDVCFVTLVYPDGTLGHIHVSWMNPRKVRTLTVVGERKMAHWDDLDTSDPIRVYDKGLDENPHYDSFGEFKYLLRSGDVHLPSIRQTEPLVNQAQAFLDWVLEDKRSDSDAACGAQVVAVLEAATRSMAGGGAAVTVETGDLALCDVT
jgi:predicted dehydrogenase